MAANDSYRDELEAARGRVRTLEARVAEKDAALDARDVEVAELRRRLERLEQLDDTSDHDKAKANDTPPAARPGWRRWLWLAAPASLLVGLGVFGAWAVQPEKPKQPQEPKKAATAPPVASTLPTRGKTYLWHGTPRRPERDPSKMPLRADVDRDGQDDVIGLVYTPGKEGHVYVGAFSGADAKPLWLSEKMGWLPEGISDAYVVLTGDVVLAHDTSNAVHVLDVATGKARHRQALTKPFAEFCNGKNGPLVVLADGTSLRWDATSSSLQASSKSCVAFVERPTPEPPAIDDFKRVSRVQNRDRQFILGSSGRLGQPYVVGLRRATGHIAWRVPASGHPDKLAATPWSQHVFAHGHGCVYVEVEPAELTADGAKATGARELVCLDQATGKRRWVTDLSSSSVLASAFVVSGDGLFIVRQTQLDIFDAKTGKHRGYIGWH